MEKAEKITFIKNYMDQMKASFISKVDKMPDNWDGIELRWMIAEAFDQEILPNYQNKRLGRYRDYANEKIIKNF